MKFSIPLLLGVLLLAGCATSPSFATRKQERLAVYQALSPEERAAVDQGLLKAGMSTNAVYIAWGNPTQVTHGGNETGEATTWTYQDGYISETRYWGGYRMHYGYTPLVYTRAQVTFVNGAVKNWQTFPAPGY